MRELNATGNYISCYVSVERCQGVANPGQSMPAICSAIREYSNIFNLSVPAVDRQTDPNSMLSAILINWAEIVAPKPLVVLFDEVDVLEGDSLISFLRQLRGGFATRGIGKFPISVALVGMRDLKDYITQAKNGIPVNPGSPFNIKEDSAVLSNFTEKNIAELFAQRTAETAIHNGDSGQQITQEALDYVWQQSCGQPWIVNNLFMRATLQVIEDGKYDTVTVEHIKEARKIMITARETHLDSLSKRLYDDRVKHVIEPILTGEISEILGRDDDDVQYVMDMGLVKWSHEEGLIIANPIYEEILLRVLNSRYHDSTPAPSNFKWQDSKGCLDMDSLLKEFQKFWRRHADMWEEKSDYTEAFPHLLLLGFLQRIINGGGYIDREVAAGRGRMDLFVKYKEQKFIIEIKLWRSNDSYSTVLDEGKEQTSRYRSLVSPDSPAYLVIFDRRKPDDKAPWDDRLTWQETDGITVVGV
jgi:hypothetical protein